MSDPQDRPQNPPQHEPVEAETRAVGPAASKVGIQVMVLSGSAKGTSKPLGDKMRIGKAPDNDLVLEDDTVSEIMVNGPYDVWVERAGRLHRTPVRFADEGHLLRIISKIVAQVGRRIDESQPMVDARLPDGSRVNATIPPLSLTGPLLTIRKFGKYKLDMDALMKKGALSPDTADLLAR